MKPELDNKLCQDFPKLYRQRGAPMQESCMYWGFEVGDGWEPLIRELSSKLEEINNRPGFATSVEAAQVKEKFGSLRYYLSVDTEDTLMYDLVQALVDVYEYRSSNTCEICGKYGETRTEGWWRTLCETHHQERQNARVLSK